jgi:hypothetical protein
VAEPWSNDFDALAAQSRAGLRSLDATRAALSRPKETRMRYFKTHPALAALVVFLALGLVSGAAYAVVHEVWVSIDSSKPAAEIQQDVQAQLAAQGMNGTVTAQKTDDGRLKVMIRSTGSGDVDVPDVHVQVDGSDQDQATNSRSVRVALTCQLDDAQQARLTAVTSSPAFQALVAPDDDGSAGAGSAGSDADRAAAITQLFAAQGFHAVQVQVDGGDVQVTITAPPT